MIEKLISNELVQSNEYHLEILERISDIFLSLDKKSCVTYINKNACNYLNTTPEKILGKNIWNVYPEIIDFPFYNACHEAMEKQERGYVSNYSKVFNFWYECSIYPSPNGLSIFIRDITEIKIAEKGLQNYRFALDQSSIVNVSDRNGLIQYANENCCKISGYSLEELLNHDLLFFNSGYHGNDFYTNLWATISEGKVWKNEIKNKAKDGSIFWTETTIVPFLDESGNPIQFISISSDITALKKAQEEVIMERDLLDNIINNLPGIIYLCDKERKILRWNKFLEIISNYSAEEIGQMDQLDFFEGEEREKALHAINETFKNGEHSVQVIASTKTRGKIPYYFRGKSVKYKGNDCLLGVAIDFSELIKAQELIKKNADEIRELANHLQNIKEQERKRIAREIHDDLGQLLVALKMNIVWVDKEAPTELKKIKEKLKYSLSLIDSGNLSIRRILSELRPHLLEAYGLLEALRSYGNEFTERTGIQLEFEVDEINTNISDIISECIFRIFQEILTNILRYANANKIFILLKIIDGKIIFTIEDDGIGFELTSINHKKSFGITGIKERVYALAGEFELISEIGKGTKINISLPI